MPIYLPSENAHVFSCAVPVPTVLFPSLHSPARTAAPPPARVRPRCGRDWERARSIGRLHLRRYSWGRLDATFKARHVSHLIGAQIYFGSASYRTGTTTTSTSRRQTRGNGGLSVAIGSLPIICAMRAFSRRFVRFCAFLPCSFSVGPPFLRRGERASVESFAPPTSLAWTPIRFGFWDQSCSAIPSARARASGTEGANRVRAWRVLDLRYSTRRTSISFSGRSSPPE